MRFAPLTFMAALGAALLLATLANAAAAEPAVAAAGTATAVNGKTVLLKRPQANLIPELYPEKYPGLKARPTPALALDQLPSEFNWCAQGSGCVSNWQQHLPKYFPLCYLHATLTMVADRIRHALHGSGVPDVVLSRQDVLDCAGAAGYGQDAGGGGEGVDVLEYLRQHGVPDETCNPFTGKLDNKCNAKQRCRNCMMLQNDNLPHCFDVPNFVRYRVTDYGFLSGEAAMMTEIQARGPITCGIAVDDDFCFNYRGGIYRDPNNATEVDHDVEVVGWGEQAQINGSVLKFWVIRNSWGSYWGHNGFFLLERGVNAMRLEEKCLFANPDVSELNAHLAGNSVGSMFGLIPPSAAPRMLPPGWKRAKHDFMTAKEVAAGKKEGEDVDAWIEANLPNGRPVSYAMYPPLDAAVKPAAEGSETAGGVALLATGAPVTTAAAPAAEGTETANKPSSSIFETAWFWVTIGFAVIAVCTYYCLIRTGQSRGYEPISDRSATV